MNKISLLDCTLRDGGYINNWNFGESAISEITDKLISSNIDIVEIGFLKNEPINKNRSVFSDINQITPLIREKKDDTLYAAMIDVQGRIPIEMISPMTQETIDVIRVIVWKRLLKEDFEYCRQIVQKGYKLCVQPARVDQYSDSEFIDMLKMFETLNPLAIYIVDSWGTQTIEHIMHYVELADAIMDKKICIGYHGHNNMQQAFGIAESFMQKGMDRDKIVDASVYGIGRGAGNLCTETIAAYLNSTFKKKYQIEPLIDIYDKYISEIYNKNRWGYSIPLYITALNNCNPEYGIYCANRNLKNVQVARILAKLQGDEKIRYDPSLIKKLVSIILAENNNGADF